MTRKRKDRGHSCCFRLCRCLLLTWLCSQSLFGAVHGAPWSACVVWVLCCCHHFLLCWVPGERIQQQHCNWQWEHSAKGFINGDRLSCIKTSSSSGKSSLYCNNIIYCEPDVKLSSTVSVNFSQNNNFLSDQSKKKPAITRLRVYSSVGISNGALS